MARGGFRKGAGRKPGTEKKKTFTFYLSEDLVKLLKDEAKKYKASTSELLNAILDHELK